MLNEPCEPCKDETPLVSVIIPSWNRKESLGRAIESVLAQDGISLEVLVCDDGSTDGTIEMVENWPDGRVQLVSGQHAGRPAIPRNRGIAAASGEWIAFLDDDDIWLPGKLKAQLQLANERCYLALTTNALRAQPGQSEYPPYFSNHLSSIFYFNTLLWANLVITSSVLIHKSLFKKTIGFPESPLLIAYEDYSLWLRVSNITPFGYIEKPYVIYTDTPSTTIRKFGNNDKMFKLRVYRNWLIWAGLRAWSMNGLLVLVRMLQLYMPKKSV
jgi:glycosyltransferase involved in cell wall biosynthesis